MVHLIDEIVHDLEKPFPPIRSRSVSTISRRVANMKSEDLDDSSSVIQFSSSSQKIARTRSSQNLIRRGSRIDLRRNSILSQSSSISSIGTVICAQTSKIWIQPLFGSFHLTSVLLMIKYILFYFFYFHLALILSLSISSFPTPQKKIDLREEIEGQDTIIFHKLCSFFLLHLSQICYQFLKKKSLGLKFSIIRALDIDVFEVLWKKDGKNYTPRKHG